MDERLPNLVHATAAVECSAFTFVFFSGGGRVEYLVEVVEVVGAEELQLLAQLVGRAGTQLIEEVVVALLLALRDDAGLFEQVVRDEAAGHRQTLTEVDLDELAEARAVVVPRRFGVAERLQQRISCK